MTLDAILEEIKALPVRERKPLIQRIIDSLPDDGAAPPTLRRSIVELRGRNKEIGQGIDARRMLIPCGVNGPRCAAINRAVEATWRRHKNRCRRYGVYKSYPTKACASDLSAARNE